MILYHVQGHGHTKSFDFVHRLLNDGSNKFVFTIDGKSHTDDEHIHSLRTKENTLDVRKSFPISWISISQIDSILEAMSAGLRLDSSWKYFINLSTTDVPLRSQASIKKVLDDDFRDKEHYGYVLNHRSVAFEPICWSGEGGPANEKRFRPDMKFMISSQVSEFFESWQASPLLSLNLRPAMHSTELAEDGCIYVRPLFESETQFRANFFRRFPYTVGRVWVCLHRSLCQWLVNSEETVFVREALKSTLVPDEAFFQTLLFSDYSPFKKFIKPYNLHHRQGDPMDISDGDLDELIASKALFARKFDSNNAPRVHDWLLTSRD